MPSSLFRLPCLNNSGIRFSKSWYVYDQTLFILQVYLGEQYVNNATLSDVTFLVEGLMLFVHLVSSLTL